MPPEVLKRSAQNEGNLLISKFASIILGTYALTLYSSISPESLGIRRDQPRGVVLVGFAAGLLLVYWSKAMMALGRRFAPSGWQPEPFLFREPVWKLALVILVGGFAEEFWRALCLILFDRANYSAGSAVLITSLVFGLGHLLSPQPVPRALGRIMRAATGGAFLGGLFLWFGTLTVPYIAHVLVNSFAALMGRKAVIAKQTSSDLRNESHV